MNTSLSAFCADMCIVDITSVEIPFSSNSFSGIGSGSNIVTKKAENVQDVVFCQPEVDLVKETAIEEGEKTQRGLEQRMRVSLDKSSITFKTDPRECEIREDNLYGVYPAAYPKRITKKTIFWKKLCQSSSMRSLTTSLTKSAES